MDFNKLVMITDGIILRKTDLKINNYSTDSRTINSDDVFIPLKGDNFDGEKYLEDAAKYASIVFTTSNDINKIIEVNPYIGIIKVDDTLEALKKIAIYYRNIYEGEIIAVTGSNGKTTTKELLYSVLSVKYNVFKSYKNYNNIIGICKMILSLGNEEKAIFELGMNHEGEIDEMVNILKPHIGIITNIGTSHIGNLKTKENILKAKLEIINNEIKILVLNRDDEYLNKVSFDKTLWFCIDDISYSLLDDKIIVKYGDEIIEVKTCGKQNVSNISAVITLAKYFELTPEQIKKGLENYDSVRLKKIKFGNTLLIDDTYNANMESMIMGIDYVDSLKIKNKILVLGDMLELGIDSVYYHKEVGIHIRNTSINKVYTFGSDSRYIGSSCQKISYHYTNIDELIDIIKYEMSDDTVIYFKASRRMQLERVINSVILDKKRI